MSERIATDQSLAGPGQDRLRALLATIVPASDDGVMPSAGELDLAAFVAELETREPGVAASLTDLLATLPSGFEDRDLAARVVAVQALAARQPQVFNVLVFTTYACYYRDDRALAGIGMQAGPPFPRGNDVEAGDLALLDPVIARDKRYRKAT